MVARASVYGAGTDTRMTYARNPFVGCDPVVAGPKSSTKAWVVAAGLVSTQLPTGAFVSAKDCQSHCAPSSRSANWMA